MTMTEPLKQIDISKLATSAVGATAMYAAVKAADAVNDREPTVEELIAIGEHAEALATFGHDAKEDSKGYWQQQGVGAWPERVTMNSLNGIKKYEGPAAYQKALKRLWRDSPERSRKIGAPEPDRLSA
jgi:hypothetical protein